jgi:hypothetical protein
MQTRGGSEVATDEIDQNHPSNHYIEHLKTVIPGSSEVPDTGVCSASTGLLPVAKNPLSTCAGKTVKAKIDHPTAALYSENVLPAEVPSPPIIPSADETLQYHLTKVDRQKQPGPTKRITHQRTDSTVSLASISSVSSIHGSNLPQWEQFDVLPREQESYTSFPKYQSNSMRSSSFMRIGAKIIGEDSKSGLSGIRGFLSRVWSKKDRNNDSVYRPSTLQRSSSAEEDEDHDDDDDRTVDSNSIISATRHSHAKVKTKAGPLLDLDARSGCSANHLESDTAKASFNIASQKLVFQDDKKGIIKDDEVHIVTGRKNSR